LLIVMLLASCGKTGSAENSDTSVQNDVATETEAETEAEDPIASRTLKDDVPDKNFNGADFRVLAQGNLTNFFEMYVPELTGDSMNDAVYNRNEIIQDRFNIKIPEPNLMNHSDVATQARAAVQAGEDMYDLVLGQMEESGKMAVEGNFRNIRDLPYVDFSKPWYSFSLAREGVGTINGKAFTIVSDLNYSYTGQSWCMIYDKDIALDYGITNVYNLVVEGKWTFDKLSELTKDIYVDVNGNTQRDGEDYYGILYFPQWGGLASSIYGMGIRTTELNGQEIVFSLNNERAVSAFEKIIQLRKETGTFETTLESILTLIPAGRGLFSNLQLRHCYDYMRDYENTYAIIPQPKFDETQSEYYTITDAGCNITAVLITAQNDEMIGAMIEALSAESWRTVTPAYVDIALGQKSARDPQSREMVNLVLDSRYMDFAYLYNGFEGWTYRLNEFLQEGQFSSAYDRNEGVVRVYYEKALQIFYEN